MIVLIQILVIAAAVFVIVRTLGTRSSHSGKAWKKIGLLLLALAMIVAVLFPEATNITARAVGVGRGADLLLYATVVAFIAYVLNDYLKGQEHRDTEVRLGRKIAIIEANERYNIHG